MANEKEEKMGEVKWTEHVRDILNGYFEGTKFHAETQVKLPYGIMITGFEDGWMPKCDAEKMNTFTTDLVIYEERKGIVVPRVVIEAKILDASTHDVITYGKKAAMHRALMPYLRYGIMIGASKSEALTWKHFTHGSDFDFMFSFKSHELDEKEREEFIKLVKSEIKISEKLEKLLDSKGEGSDICCVRRKLDVFK